MTDDAMVEKVARAWRDERSRWNLRRSIDKSCWQVTYDTKPGEPIDDDTFQVVEEIALERMPLGAQDRYNEICDTASARAAIAATGVEEMREAFAPVIRSAQNAATDDGVTVHLNGSDVDAIVRVAALGTTREEPK